MKTMKRFVGKVLGHFSTEAPLYERAGIPVEFVGHPLVDSAQSQAQRVSR